MRTAGSLRYVFSLDVSLVAEKPTTGPSCNLFCWSTFGYNTAYNGFSAANSSNVRELAVSLESESSIWSRRLVESSVSEISSTTSANWLEGSSEISLDTFSESSLLSSDSISRKYWLISSSWGNNSWYSYVSQNSNWAVDCNSFLALSVSLIPGSSTKILPAVSNLWIFGWVTPNLSILLLKILNERFIASSTSILIKSKTCWFVEEKFIFSLKSGVLNTPASPEFGAGAIFSYSFPNKVTKSSWLFDWSFSALEIAWLNFSSLLLFESALITSTTMTSKVTFIPPFKSNPRLISLCLHSE